MRYLPWPNPPRNRELWTFYTLWWLLTLPLQITSFKSTDFSSTKAVAVFVWFNYWRRPFHMRIFLKRGKKDYRHRIDVPLSACTHSRVREFYVGVKLAETHACVRAAAPQTFLNSGFSSNGSQPLDTETRNVSHVINTNERQTRVADHSSRPSKTTVHFVGPNIKRSSNCLRLLSRKRWSWINTELW